MARITAARGRAAHADHLTSDVLASAAPVVSPEGVMVALDGIVPPDGDDGEGARVSLLVRRW